MRRVRAAWSVRFVLAAIVLAAVLVPSAAAASDPLLVTVPSGTDYVLSLAADPLGGTAFWRLLLPAFLGHPTLFSHPDAPFIERVLVAGRTPAFPEWSVVSAFGRFVRSAADPDLDLLGAFGLPLAYANPLPASPALFGITAVGRTLDSLEAILAPRFRRDPLPPVAEHAAGLMPRRAPPLWVAMRLEDVSLLSLLPQPFTVPFGQAAVLRGALVFVSLESYEDRRFSAVLDFPDAAAAADGAALLASILDRAVAEGVPVTVDPPVADARRVRLAVELPAGVFGWIFG